MVDAKSGANPFYVLLVLVGIVFTLTVCAYGVLTVRDMRRDISVEASESGQGLLKFLDRHGFKLLGAELGLLALFTVAAMVTDEYWTKQAAKKKRSPQDAD